LFSYFCFNFWFVDPCSDDWLSLTSKTMNSLVNPVPSIWIDRVHTKMDSIWAPVKEEEAEFIVFKIWTTYSSIEFQYRLFWKQTFFPSVTDTDCLFVSIEYEFNVFQPLHAVWVCAFLPKFTFPQIFILPNIPIDENSFSYSRNSFCLNFAEKRERLIMRKRKFYFADRDFFLRLKKICYLIQFVRSRFSLDHVSPESSSFFILITNLPYNFF
jgi:hypothetical protein